MGIPLTLSSVPLETPYIQYVSTNGQTVFPYPFAITQDSDLIVVVGGNTLATDSGYTLDGQGNPTGGNVNFTLGQTAGAIITIFRDIPIERLSQIAQNSGFSSTVFNAEFNNIYLLLQQLESSLGQCLQLPNTNSPAGTTTLLPGAYANKYLSFDSNGNPVPAVLTSSGTLTTTILGNLLYPRTATEIAAAVTPSNYAYPNGPTRYGAVGDGVANDTSPFSQMGLVGGIHYLQNGTYKLSSKVQTSAVVSLIGSTRQATILEPTAFADYMLEIGSVAGGPNPNVGEISRIRFLNGTATNSGLLHMNSLSHMWRLESLLFQSSPCPALVVDDCWDSNYSNIDILSCGYTGQPANVGAALKIINGCNNVYFRGLRVEQCPSGCIFVDAGQSPIMIDQGKCDQGFITQSAACITMIANSGVKLGSSLVIDNFSITGVNLQYSFSLSGFTSLTLGKVTVSGGTGLGAHISDRRTWGHIDSATYPTAGTAAFEPTIARLDLGQSTFGYGHPSQGSQVTGAVVNSKITPFRAVAQFTMNANGAVSGNTIIVGTGLTAATNNLYAGMYAVHNSTGTQAAGQAGARRKILQSFTNGQLLLAGSWGVTLDADWSVEYSGGQYTPNFHADGISMDNGMDLFQVLQTGATISALAYAAAGGAAGGCTAFTLTAANFPINTDCTGYFLVDELTGEPYYLHYGVDGAGKAAVLYDRTSGTGALNTTHTYSIVAGYAANIKQNGTRFEWAFAGRTMSAEIATCDIYGFDINNMPLWGIGENFGSFTGTLTGMTAGTTGTIGWTRSGNIVTLSSSASILGTSNTTAMTMTGLPTALIPAGIRRIACACITDASSDFQAGQTQIDTAGLITFGLALVSSPRLNLNGVFTNAGNKGIDAGWTVTYSLV